MAQNTVYADGNYIPVPAPYAVSSGDGVLIGALFGVAQSDAAAGATVVIKTTGSAWLKKAGSQAWNVGDRIYWDNTNKRCTTSATGNTLIGAAIAAVGNGATETLGHVRLDGATR